MKLSIVIPAHNEENHINRVVTELRNELLGEGIDFEIVIVDDNSRDRTAEISDALVKNFKDTKVIHRVGNNGFGRAIRDGLASMKGECVILVMADSSDDPKDVVRIFRKLEEGYDVVYGSRFIRGAKVYNYPSFKLILNRLANHFIRTLFLMRENDITNAFKGYNARVIKRLWPLEADHFNITAELPLKAYVNNFTKVMIPVNWYGRDSGVSKLSIMRMGQRYLRTVLEIWAAWILNKLNRRKYENADAHWEEYWQEKEDSTPLGRALFKFREKFWVRSFVRFAIEETKKGKVLEAGCGSALGSIFLSKERGDTITALDISKAALRKARDSAGRFKVPIRLVNGDIYRLPFSCKNFNLAWNSGTLEHFADPIPILKEMGRVAREVICIVPAKGLSFLFLSKISGIFGKGFKSYFIRDDEIFYTPESLSEAVKKAGFNNVHAKKIYCAGLFPYVAVHFKS